MRKHVKGITTCRLSWLKGETQLKKYGQIALIAVQSIKNKEYMNPADAWEKAALELFGEGSSNAVKGCPRSAFLGLCEEGIISGVPPGRYTRSVKNKAYAIKSLQLLKENPELANNAGALWERITGGKVSHNAQMDVVIALWKKGLIL